MKIDLDKEGLHMFFKDWEVPLVTKLLTEEVEMDSRTAMNYVNERIAPDKISRATAIISLQNMEGNNVLLSRQETVKGGPKAIYWRRTNMAGFLDGVVGNLLGRLQGLRE